MAQGQNQNRGVDVLGKAKEAASNLSDAAKLVLNTIHTYIMGPVSEGGEGSLQALANKQAAEKLPADSIEMIAFQEEAEAMRDSITAQAQEDGASRKELAVISNYFTKLTKGTVNASDHEAAPPTAIG